MENKLFHSNKYVCIRIESAKRIQQKWKKLLTRVKF